MKECMTQQALLTTHKQQCPMPLQHSTSTQDGSATKVKQD